MYIELSTLDILAKDSVTIMKTFVDDLQIVIRSSAGRNRLIQIERAHAHTGARRDKACSKKF